MTEEPEEAIVQTALCHQEVNFMLEEEDKEEEEKEEEKKKIILTSFGRFGFFLFISDNYKKY